MGSQVKALATTPNNLSYIPRTHMVQKRTDSYKSDLHSLTHSLTKIIKVVRKKPLTYSGQLQSLKHTDDSLKISSTTGVI